MAERFTRGISWGTEGPAFTGEERATLAKSLGDNKSENVWEQISDLRRTYFQIYTSIENMPTKADAEKLRDDLLSITERIENIAREISLECGDGLPKQDVVEGPSGPAFGMRFTTDQALQQLFGEKYSQARTELFIAAEQLRNILRRPCDIEKDFSDLRGNKSGRAAGLRIVLFLLNERVGSGIRRGESWGLDMGSGEGRGARRLHEFLTVLTSQETTGDDVRNAMKWVKPALEENRDMPSGFGEGGLIMYPTFWPTEKSKA